MGNTSGERCDGGQCIRVRNPFSTEDQVCIFLKPAVFDSLHSLKVPQYNKVPSSSQGYSEPSPKQLQLMFPNSTPSRRCLNLLLLLLRFFCGNFDQADYLLVASAGVDGTCSSGECT